MVAATRSVRARLHRLEESAQPQGDFGDRLQRAIDAIDADEAKAEAGMRATLAQLRADPPGRLRDRLLRAYEVWAEGA